MQYIKTLICFLWLVLLTSAAQAEDHKVYIESFTHEPMDQSAKKASEMDGDGALYAIVKVRPSSKNFQLSFGAMSCKVQGEHDGETWLFVQKNASIISIRREGFTPIINKGLGMNIQAGETYILNLSYVEPRFSQQKQYLKFNVSPREESATVKVKRDGDADYEIWGQTSDGTIARLLECGKYQYQIWAENYERVEGQVMLNQPDETHVERVSLQANFGYLEVGDAYGISGARIYIDDKPVGTIPYKNKWPAGKYRLSVTGELFKTYNQTFEIKKGETTVLLPNPESNSGESVACRCRCRHLCGQEVGRQPKVARSSQ